MLVISLQRELPFAAMTHNRRFIGIAGVLGALGFWSTLPARAEEPAKPAQAAALPSESDELKALRLAAEKAKKALPAAQAAVALEGNRTLKTRGVQQACAIRRQAASQAWESCDARCECGSRRHADTQIAGMRTRKSPPRGHANRRHADTQIAGTRTG